MSFTISKVESAPFLGEEANKYVTKSFSLITPTDQLLSQLPLLKNLKTRPFSCPTGACMFLDAILDFDVRSDDVFVCSTPKCGSSWVQTIVWLLTHDLDYKTTQSVDSERLIGSFNRSNGLENRADLFVNGDPKQLNKEAAKIAWNEKFEQFQLARIIKTFFPIYYLPKNVWSKGAKIVYVVRDPKDMVVSEYHFLRNSYFFDANFTMDDIVNGVANDAWSLSPRGDNVLNFWNARHLPNVFFVAYEDLVTDSFSTIKKISEFLECNYTDQQLMELTEYVSFENMRKIQTINRDGYIASMERHIGKTRPDAGYKFLRKGKIGAYHDDLNKDQIKKLDDWARKVEQDSDFKFKI